MQPSAAVTTAIPEYRLGVHRGKFVAEWRDETGARFRHSLGVSIGSETDKAAAESALRDFKSEVAREAAPAVLLTGHIVERYLAEHKVVSAKPMQFAWAAARGTFAHLRPDQITKDDCEAYAATRFTKPRTLKDGTVTKPSAPCKPETIIKELGVIRNAFGWASDIKELKASVAGAKVWTPPPGEPRDLRLTREQVGRILGLKMMRHVRLFMLLAIGTAARHSAILELTWDRVNLEMRVINYKVQAGDVFAARRKGRAEIGMNDMLFEALTKAKAEATTPYVVEYDGGKIGSVKKAITTLSQLAGVKFTSHVLRHTAATWLAEAGVKLEVIGQMLGHKSINTTYRIYARYTPEFKARAAQALNVLQLVPAAPASAPAAVS